MDARLERLRQACSRRRRSSSGRRSWPTPERTASSIAAGNESFEVIRRLADGPRSAPRSMDDVARARSITAREGEHRAHRGDDQRSVMERRYAELPAGDPHAPSSRSCSPTPARNSLLIAANRGGPRRDRRTSITKLVDGGADPTPRSGCFVLRGARRPRARRRSRRGCERLMRPAPGVARPAAEQPVGPRLDRGGPDRQHGHRRRELRRERRDRPKSLIDVLVDAEGHEAVDGPRRSR